MKGISLGDKYHNLLIQRPLSSTNPFSLNFTEISASSDVKISPSRRIVNVALLSVLTYLYKSDQPTRMFTPQMDRHVRVPKDDVAFLEFVGLVFETSIILEDKLEVGLWMCLHKIDRYFYETI